MRRNHLTLFLALPTALAFSLSNFQEITSTLIPLSCLLTYDTQMSDCKKKDFSRGCSDSCVANLLSIQADVQDSCSQVTVNSQTLLGIVKSGGIVVALCPEVLSTATSTTAKATTSTTNTRPQVSVTIPTASPGVTVSKTTATVQSTVSSSSPAPNSSLISLTISSSTTSPTTSSTSEQVVITSTTSTTPSAQAVSSPTTTSSNKGAAAAGSNSGSTSTPKPDPGTGGGSPFDISSSGSIVGYNWVWSVVLAIVWTGLFFGR